MTNILFRIQKLLLCSVIVLCQLLVGALVSAHSANAQPNVSKPVALDSRIKTYIYSENEVFRLVVHYGYQTSIEFAEGEEIQTISSGNSFAWQLTPIGRRLFIKPLEENILTNITILTNKRAYHFEMQSKNISYTNDEELVYVIRFFYPTEDFDLGNVDVVGKEAEPIPTIKPFNFNYTLSGSHTISPTKVFDDGVNTFFKFPESVTSVPKIDIMKGGAYHHLTPRKRGVYVVVNSVGSEFKISQGNQVALVFNENLQAKGE